MLVAGSIAIALQRPTYQEFATRRGHQGKVVLADGSILDLDAQTRVSVVLRSAQRQLQLLEGRARFDVAHDANRPFTVGVGDKTVLATGTSFSMERIDGKLHVIVYGGKVIVLSGNIPDPSTLVALRSNPRASDVPVDAGQELIAEEGSSRGLVRPSDRQSDAWLTGQLEFSNEPLADAVARFNRYSANTILVDRRIAAVRVDGVFNVGDGEAFIAALTNLYPVRARRSGVDEDVVEPTGAR